MARGEARAKILEAADGLFGEVGFDATTTRRIGEISGVNKALIHYHFRDKQKLFFTVLDRYYEELGGALQAALAAPGDVRTRMVRLIEAYVDFLEENQNYSRMVQREVAGGRHVERITEHMTPLFELGSKLIERAFPGAAAGPLAADQLMVSFYGMIVSYFSYAPVLAGLVGGDPLTPARLAARKQHLERMVDLVLAAVAEPDHDHDEDNP